MENLMRRLALILTFMLSGRMMTLAFIHRAGGDGAGDPPIAWLMPLIGDAVIGLSGLALFVLMLTRSGVWVWILALIWNALGIWDALSAYIVHRTTPWPEFFMIEFFGSSMFYMATAMHVVLLYLLVKTSAKGAVAGQP